MRFYIRTIVLVYDVVKERLWKGKGPVTSQVGTGDEIENIVPQQVIHVPEKACGSVHISTRPSLVDVVVEHVAQAKENHARVGCVLVVAGTKLAILRCASCGTCTTVCESLPTATMRWQPGGYCRK